MTISALRVGHFFMGQVIDTSVEALAEAFAEQAEHFRAKSYTKKRCNDFLVLPMAQGQSSRGENISLIARPWHHWNMDDECIIVQALISSDTKPRQIFATNYSLDAADQTANILKSVLEENTLRPVGMSLDCSAEATRVKLIKTQPSLKATGFSLVERVTGGKLAQLLL